MDAPLTASPVGRLFARVDRVAGQRERRTRPGPGAGREGQIDRPDPDPDAPVVLPDQVGHQVDHRAGVVQHALHLVAGGPFEATHPASVPAGEAAQQVIDPVARAAAVALVDGQHEHWSSLGP